MEKLFEVNQLELVEKTKAIIDTIPEKAIIPANAYVHLKSFEGEIAVSASNPENTTRIILESGIFDHPFDICIDSSFLKPLKKRDISLTFSQENNRCFITCPDSKWEVPMIDPEEFPELEKEWEELFTIESDLLKEILEKISPFTYQNQDTSISKIHFKNTEDYISIGATTQFSCCSYKLNKQIEKEISFLISRETALLIRDIAITDSVTIFKSQDNSNSLRFLCLDNSVTAIGHAFDGNPVNNYHGMTQKYLERKYDTITVIDKNYLKEQIQKAIAFSPFNTKSLLVHILGNRLRLEVEDYISHKRSVQEIEVLLEQEGDATLVGLPYDHLIKILSGIKNESIEIMVPLSHGKDQRCIKDALLIQDEKYTYLIMPLIV